MPLLSSTYSSPFPVRQGHLQTFASAFRKVSGVFYKRERISTPDGDFLDLDWFRGGHSRLAILSHGLEGNSSRSYILGMARALARRGWDILAWNCRGCSGAPNILPKLYHSGATEDLDAVVQHAIKEDPQRDISLIGFSLGGNLTLKYLGERGDSLAAQIRSGVTFSVPCDLAGCSSNLSKRQNRIYMEYFLRSLREKIREKGVRFPGLIDTKNLASIRSFQEFDDRFTAPLHGFKDAKDYWEKNSCIHILEDIRRPTLLVNALDDPFLSPSCYPKEQALRSPWLHLEIPRRGGHVGFFGLTKELWSEQRASKFLDEFSGGFPGGFPGESSV